MLSFKRVAQSVAPVQVLAKAEWYNPGGSVKDRAALAMMLDGERRGLAAKNKRLFEATPGPTGVPHATMGGGRGEPVEIAPPTETHPDGPQKPVAHWSAPGPVRPAE